MTEVSALQIALMQEQLNQEADTSVQGEKLGSFVNDVSAPPFTFVVDQSSNASYTLPL